MGHSPECDCGPPLGKVEPLAHPQHAIVPADMPDCADELVRVAVLNAHISKRSARASTVGPASPAVSAARARRRPVSGVPTGIPHRILLEWFYSLPALVE